MCRIKLLGLLIEIQVGYTTKEDYDFNIDHDTFNKYIIYKITVYFP